MDSIRVSVYGKPDCTQCVATVRALESKGFSYAYFNLAAMPDKAAEFARQGLLTAPVVEVEVDGVPTVWAGFRPDMLMELVRAREVVG